MSNLRSNQIDQYFQLDLPAQESTMFRYYELEKNQLFKADNKEYVHLFFLLEGEIRIGGTKSMKSIVIPKELFFISNNRFICRSVKESAFILFSINRFHYQANPIMYRDILSVITELRDHYSPLTMPNILFMFAKILAGYMKDGINSEHLQRLKQTELFMILHSLYRKGRDNDIPMYGRLSLS